MTAGDSLDDTNAERTLALTRAQFRAILEPEDEHVTGERFPRSRTIRALTGRVAISALAAGAVVILATRPGLAARLARAVPLLNLIRRLAVGIR